MFITQASQGLPLYWGLVPEDKKADVVKVFRKTLVDEQAFIAGEVGLPYVIQTARENGMNDFSCSFKTPQGVIKVSAQRNGKEVELNVDVPDTIEYLVDRSNLD